MSSEAQTEANRENAQHSTGPKTDAGKAAASQNAHRHGLAAGLFTVLPWERQSEYDELVDSLLHQFFEGSLGIVPNAKGANWVRFAIGKESVSPSSTPKSHAWPPQSR